MNEELLTTKEICHKLNVSRSTIEAYRKKGMPLAIDIPRGMKRYNYSECLEWLKTGGEK